MVDQCEDYKLLLVAIAKDEAAYLPEWISHHLSCGVDEIDLYLNGLTDNSLEIVKKVSKRYPVRFRVADYIKSPEYTYFDDCIAGKMLAKNTFQGRCYAESYVSAFARGFTHVLFFDVDEFFYSRSGNSIEQLIRETGNPDVIKLKWFNRYADEEEFMPALMPVLSGERWQHVKCIVRTNLDEIRIRTPHHIGSRDGHSSCFLVGKGAIDNKYTSFLHDSNWSEEYCLIHRWIRSRNEYIALLDRGDALTGSMGKIKVKRLGFKTAGIDQLTVPEHLIRSFAESYRNFLSGCELIDELRHAQALVLQRYQRVVETLEKHQNLNQQMETVLAGTGVSVK